VDQSYLSAFDETVEEVALTTKSSSSDSDNDCSLPRATFTIDGDDSNQPLLDEMFQDLELQHDDMQQVESEVQASNIVKELSNDAFYFFQGILCE